MSETLLGPIFKGDILSPTPIDYSNMNTEDANIMVDQFLTNKMVFDNRLDAPLTTLLMLLKSLGTIPESTKGKIINWFIGNTEPVDAALTATFLKGTGIQQIRLDRDYLLEGQMLSVKETIGGVPYSMDVKLVSKATTISAGVYEYDCKVISCITESSGAYTATPTFTTGAYVNMTAVNVPWSLTGTPDYTQRKPKQNWNAFKRTVEVVGQTDQQINAEEFLFDIGLSRQAQWKLKAVLKKIDIELLTGIVRQGPKDFERNGTAFIQDEEGGTPGCLPFFIQPYRESPSSADVAAGIAPLVGQRGVVRVIDGLWDYDKIVKFMADITKIGNNRKFRIFMGPAKTLYDIMKACTAAASIQVTMTKLTFPGTDAVYEMPTYQLAIGNVHFMPNDNMDNIPFTVIGKDPENVTGSPNISTGVGKAVYVLDPETIGLTFLNVGGKAMSPEIIVLERTKTELNDVQRAAINAMYTFVMTEVEANGMLAIK